MQLVAVAARAQWRQWSRCCYGPCCGAHVGDRHSPCSWRWAGPRSPWQQGWEKGWEKDCSGKHQRLAWVRARALSWAVQVSRLQQRKREEPQVLNNSLQSMHTALTRPSPWPSRPASPRASRRQREKGRGCSACDGHGSTAAAELQPCSGSAAVLLHLAAISPRFLAPRETLVGGWPPRPQACQGAMPSASRTAPSAAHASHPSPNNAPLGLLRTHLAPAALAASWSLRHW